MNQYWVQYCYFFHVTIPLSLCIPTPNTTVLLLRHLVIKQYYHFYQIINTVICVYVTSMMVSIHVFSEILYNDSLLRCKSLRKACAISNVISDNSLKLPPLLLTNTETTNPYSGNMTKKDRLPDATPP